MKNGGVDMGDKVSVWNWNAEDMPKWIDRLQKKRDEAAGKVKRLDRAIALVKKHPELETLFAAVVDDDR